MHLISAVDGILSNINSSSSIWVANAFESCKRYFTASHIIHLFQSLLSGLQEVILGQLSHVRSVKNWLMVSLQGGCLLARFLKKRGERVVRWKRYLRKNIFLWVPVCSNVCVLQQSAKTDHWNKFFKFLDWEPTGLSKTAEKWFRDSTYP